MWWPARDSTLTQGLLAAVRAQDFGGTLDKLRGGAPLAHFPSLDLALVRLAPGAAPLCANVLFSREHPQGLVAEMSGGSGSINNVRFEADQQDAGGASVAWLPGADWQRLRFKPLLPAHQGQHRFVAPYPASLLKLMIAVGVGLAVDRGLCSWPTALEPMIVDSDNDATNVCVALLHRLAMVDVLNRSLAEYDLHTLQLNSTQPSGGWRNGDGAGVGHIHMTAWDSVRLLWLLDAAAPPPPWLAAGTPALLQAASRDHLRALLQRQRHDHVLSSGSLRGLPGWVAGLPDAPTFAHKTGSTENYASDAGIVKTPRCHYIVALLSNLGRRYAPDERCVTPWGVPALGAAVHTLMESLP